MHDLLGFIPLDERFWVALSFVMFCLISFFPFKKIAIGAMNQKITAIQNLIENSKQISIQTATKIAELEMQLTKIEEQSASTILQARDIASKISEQHSLKLQHLSMEIRKSNKEKLAFLQNEKMSHFYTIVVNKVVTKVTQNAKINELNSLSLFNFLAINK